MFFCGLTGTNFQVATIALLGRHRADLFCIISDMLLLKAFRVYNHMAVITVKIIGINIQKIMCMYMWLKVQ